MSNSPKEILNFFVRDYYCFLFSQGFFSLHRVFESSESLYPSVLQHSTTTSWYSVVCIIPLVERELPSTNVHSFVLDSFSEMTQNKIPLLLVAHQEVLMFPLHFPSKPYSATKCLYDLGSTLFTIPGTHFYLSVFFLKCGS